MLVSAVNANLFQSKKIASEKKEKNKHSSAEKSSETAFNSLPAKTNKINASEELRLYNSINEWKDFCHMQIMNGKLDIIA